MVRSFLFFSYCIFYGVNAEHYSNNEEDQWDSGTLAYGFAYESDITTVYETINESTEQNDRSTIPDETESSSSIKDELLLPDKKCTGPNEMYIPNKKKCPPEVCSSIVSRYACDPKEKGQPGCVCKSGFLRMNLTSTCMPIKQCPELINSQEPECNKPNESLKCVKICPPARTCQNRNVFYKCANNVNEVCKNKCVCYDGFYRNPDGFCVTSDLCDKKCSGPNEKYEPNKKSCPPEICQSILAKYKCDSKEQGQPGCVCVSGFLRMNLNSTCIPVDQCPEFKDSPDFNKKCTGPNEKYIPNKKKCPPEVCSSIVSRYACDPKEEGQPGCVCKSGFLRMNLTSTCMPIRQCPELINSQEPECNKPNESLKCVKICPPARTCQNRNVFYRCANNVNEVCKNKCVCNDGFYRNPDGFCVTSDLCDKKCSGPNEKYEPNKKSCPPEICQSILAKYKCDSKEQGQPGCVCVPGFLRMNLNSTCIPVDQCPEFKDSPDFNKKCTGPNEMYIPNKKKCPPEVCSSIVSRYACDPKEEGQPGCVCKSGFLRMNLTATCMPIRQCPELINSQEPECNKPNESLKCVKICPPARTCQNRNVFYRCANNVNEVCKNKCVCNDGFYRNPDGFCVTSDLCDKKCTGPNEMYTPIKKKCPPEVCRSIVSRYACDPNEDGQPGCVCESGFLRMNLTSTCMPIKQCPELINSQEAECNKPNESLQCVKACPPARTCQNRNVSYKCANNMDEVCKNKCVCNDGFYRNPDGFCVTSDLCDVKCSGPNEMYDPNKKSCPPQICQSILALYKCDSKEQGQPGCVCKPGFLRMNLNSTCIPVDQCPEFKDSPDFNKTMCTRPNEELKCVKSCPPAKTCRNRDILFNCVHNATEVCKNKCVCKKGFYRNDGGDCVTSEMCDNLKCQINEVLVENPSPCSNQFCPQSRESIIKPCPDSISPDIKLPPRCECRFNYSRANNGSCIPTSQCPPFPCGPNEMFNACPPYCPTDDCSQATPSGKCPIFGRIGIVVPCRPQCRCIKNYWRKNNVCVPFEQCKTTSA